MPNPHHPCPGCRRRHRPGSCEKSHEVVFSCVGREGNGNLLFRSPDPAQGNQCHSIPGIIADLARICGDLTTLVGILPCMAPVKNDTIREKSSG